MIRDILSDTLEMDFRPRGLCNSSCLEQIIKTAIDYQLFNHNRFHHPDFHKMGYFLTGHSVKLSGDTSKRRRKKKMNH